MSEEKKSNFGRDYFLEALPVEWDEKLDGERPSKRKKTGDVIVNSDELQALKNLGLLK